MSSVESLEQSILKICTNKYDDDPLQLKQEMTKPNLPLHFKKQKQKRTHM